MCDAFSLWVNLQSGSSSHEHHSESKEAKKFNSDEIFQPGMLSSFKCSWTDSVKYSRSLFSPCCPCNASLLSKVKSTNNDRDVDPGK